MAIAGSLVLVDVLAAVCVAALAASTRRVNNDDSLIGGIIEY